MVTPWSHRGETVVTVVCHAGVPLRCHCGATAPVKQAARRGVQENPGFSGFRGRPSSSFRRVFVRNFYRRIQRHMAVTKVRKMRNIPFFPGSSPKSLALLENPENPGVSWALGAIHTSYYTALGFSKTRSAPPKGCRQRAGHMATEALIMPSDGGLRFDSQFTPRPIRGQRPTTKEPPWSL